MSSQQEAVFPDRQARQRGGQDRRLHPVGGGRGWVGGGSDEVGAQVGRWWGRKTDGEKAAAEEKEGDDEEQEGSEEDEEETEEEETEEDRVKDSPACDDELAGDVGNPGKLKHSSLNIVPTTKKNKSEFEIRNFSRVFFFKKRAKTESSFPVPPCSPENFCTYCTVHLHRHTVRNERGKKEHHSSYVTVCNHQITLGTGCVRFP